MAAVRRSMLLVLVPIVLFTQPGLAQSLFDSLVSVGTGVIANEIQQRQQQQQRTGQRPGQSQAAQPRSIATQQTLIVQQRLQSLGYDVGTPDGVMGPRTQRAIAVYQQSLGSTPTGVLSATEFDALVAGSSAPPQAVAASPAPTGETQDFQLLQNTDLPYNDYRSGMGDPALRGGNADACLAACAVDAQCQAFTFNTRARVCFLKNAVGTPAPFNGAISGLRAIPTAGAQYAATPEARPLTPSEIARLQAGLNARGYEVGTPDGVAGSRTRTAVARFISENPGMATTTLNAALLSAVLQQAGATPAMAPASFAPSRYRTADELKRELALIALQHEPSLLDDSGQLRSWFSAFLLNRDNPPSAMQQGYRDANAVEQEAMLERFRRDILAEAKSFVAELPGGELRVKVVTYTRLGGYSPGRGVEIENPSAPKLLELASYPANRSFVGVTLDMPEISAVPVASEAEASAFLDRVKTLSQRGNAQLVAWYTISDFGQDRNVVGAATARGTQIPMTVRLDRLSLIVARQASAGAPGEDVELAVLYDPAHLSPQQPSGAGPSDNIAIAQRLGLPVIDGHVAFSASSSNVTVLNTSANDYNSTMWRFLTLAAIRQQGQQAADWIEHRDLSRVMSPNQHLLVYGQPSGYARNFENEFERRRALNVFTHQVLPELVASAPAFPLKAVSILPVPLSDYDFAAKTFPIESRERSLFWLPPTLANYRVATSYDQLPPSVAMEEAAAERLVTASQSGRPIAYLATFGTLSLAEAGDGTLDFTPDRSALFADPSLTSPMASLELNTLFKPRQAPTEAETALASLAPTSEFEFVAELYAQLAPQGLGEDIVATSNAVRNANEFNLEQARRTVTDSLASAAPGDIWLTGTVQFGTYDLARGVFPQAVINLQSPQGENSFDANYYFTLADPRQVADIAVPEVIARKIGTTSERRVNVFARVALIDPTITGDSSYPTYQAALDVLELVLWTQFHEDGDKPTLVARINPAVKEPQAVAIAPPITELGPEALDYLRLKYAPDTIDEAGFERMLMARWTLEESRRVPEGERFFPAGTDISGADVRKRWLEDFKPWARARADAIAPELTLGDCVTTINGQNWPSPLRDTVLAARPELADAVPIERVLQKYSAPHVTGPLYFEIKGYLLEGSDCDGPVQPALRAALGDVPAKRSGAVILLADAAVPGMSNGQILEPELEVSVEDVEILPHPGGASPVLLIHAGFAAARGDGFATIDRQGYAALKAEATATPTGPGWDVVGLKPGQSLAEAEAIVRAHMDVAAVFVRKPAVRNPPHLLNEISYVSSSLAEAITLTYEPGESGDTIYGIARALGQAIDTMPVDAVLASLREKYGPERHFDPNQGQFRIVWWSEDNPKSSEVRPLMQQCFGPQASPTEGWDLREGDVASVATMPEHLQVRNGPFLPAPNGISLEIGVLDCGTVVSVYKQRSGNNDQLYVQLFDYPAYARAMADAQAAPAQPPPQPEKSTLQFKF